MNISLRITLHIKSRLLFHHLEDIGSLVNRIVENERSQGIIFIFWMILMRVEANKRKMPMRAAVLEEQTVIST